MMVEDGFDADLQTFIILFQACGRANDVEAGKKLHCDARKQGIASTAYAGSSLVRMYGRCGNVSRAEDAFRELSDRGRDVVSWNAMLSVYADRGLPKKVLRLYRQMRESRVGPDHTACAIAIHACCSLLEGGDADVAVIAKMAKAMHSEAVRNDLASHPMVSSALVKLYGICGSIGEAEHAFCGAADRNVMLWTSMLSAYVEHGASDRALRLFVRMQAEGISPDEHVFTVLLQACAAFAQREAEKLEEAGQSEEAKNVPIRLGRALHSDAKKKGFASNLFVSSALLGMYARCGSLSDAESVFCGLTYPDVVAWTAMLSASVDHGQGDQALELYRRMQKQRLAIDETTLACALRACGESGRLEACREAHFGAVSASYDYSSSFLCACLVHAYGVSSGTAADDARDVLEKSRQSDAVSWNACIASYAREADWGACLQMLRCMEMSGVDPNRVTFLSILFACSHSGSWDGAIACIDAMVRERCILPDAKHYAIVLDLLARIGDFAKAEDIMKHARARFQMNFLWPQSSLLGACLQHGNVELGREVFDSAELLLPCDYVLMSNIHASCASS
jgi:pentatricopeptide repeat protein